MKLYPRCIKGEKPPAYSATGYIVPCCWCDNVDLEKDFSFILKEKLKLENVEKVEDILLSQEWVDFFRMLRDNSNEAPSVCKKYCSSEWESKRRLNG